MLHACMCDTCAYLFASSSKELLPQSCPRCGGHVSSVLADEFSRQFEEAFSAFNLLAESMIDPTLLAQMMYSPVQQQTATLQKVISEAGTPTQLVNKLKDI